jgi:thiol-disulfide isomerase/thioredoxin
VGAAIVLFLTIAGCSTPTPDDAAPVPFAACPEASATPATGNDTVDVTLPCMAGGRTVQLSALGRPAVVNLWASSCAPCREELPALQRFADRAADRLVVLGVVTGDTRKAASETAADLGVRFPAVFDEGQLVLRSAVGRMGLPATLFVDAAGRVRFVYQSGVPLDEKSVTALVRDHLGVSVP